MARMAEVLGCCYDEEEEVLLSAAEVVRTSSCLDSGAAANVVGPDCVPGNTRITQMPQAGTTKVPVDAVSRNMVVAQPSLPTTKAVGLLAHTI